jgi:D-alanine--poly(phosphoribitol) ligase subunit 1
MLFFANRKDELIKMHGFRIELGEIDKEIHNYPKVVDAVTIPLKRRGEIIKLISFILVSKEVIIENIKESISKNLPYYMIPSDIIQLKELPYNTNHKVDKKALLEIYKKL